MTYVPNDQDDCVLPELKLMVGGGNGDYVKLPESEDGEAGGTTQQPPSPRFISRMTMNYSMFKVVERRLYCFRSMQRAVY
ncbi:hypothetical protein U1Q18_021323 [Sarracenia purpurea var. burkii]